MNYVLQLTTILAAAVRLRVNIELDMVSIQRILEYANNEPEGGSGTPENLSVQPAESWPAEGRITFDNFSARYGAHLPTCLSNINLVIEPGQKVAVVGRTGAGKSSLALTLGRFLEAAGGSISIDGISIDTVDLEVLRKRVVSIPQEPQVFSGSLRQNLDPEQLHDDDFIQQVLETSGLNRIFTGGLDFEVKSGGYKSQHICTYFCTHYH
jgi:ATP-binding cassette subfamily C (CFTR/MRP) protein 1